MDSLARATFSNGATVASIRAGPFGVSTKRATTGRLLAGRLCFIRKIRLNRSQRHRQKGGSRWFIGVHSWLVGGARVRSCGGSEFPRQRTRALTGSKGVLPDQAVLARP